MLGPIALMPPLWRGDAISVAEADQIADHKLHDPKVIVG